MKKILLGLAILFLITSLSYCQESKQPLQRFDKGSPLELTIKSDKNVYEVGEPVNIELKLSNVEQEPLSFEVYSYIGEPYITFEIFGSQGNRINYLKLFPGIPIQTKIKLWSGTFYGTIINLTDGYDIEKPDAYTIIGKWNLFDSKLISNAITIEIAEKK